MTVLLPRRQALDDRVDYFLDCAQEAGELDSCSAMALRLYGDDAAVLNAIGPLAKPSLEARLAANDALVDMADGILPALPPERAGGLVRLGMGYVVSEATSLAECFSGWAIDDEIDGGAILPFRDRPRSRKGIAFKRTGRRLRSPRFIRRSVKSRVDAAARLRAASSRMLERAALYPPCHDKAIMADWRALIKVHERSLQAVERRDARAARRVVLRSYRAAVSILGAEVVSAFVRGESIRLSGRDAMLVVKKRGALADRGHGCLSVGLASRDGVLLADLCTFVDRTPTLDQLAAFALWMKAGDEMGVVASANFIEVTAEGKGHALIESGRAVQRERAMADLVEIMGDERAQKIAAILTGRRPARRQLTYEQWRARNDSYWRATMGTWLEATFALVIGRQNFGAYKRAGAL